MTHAISRVATTGDRGRGEKRSLQRKCREQLLQGDGLVKESTAEIAWLIRRRGHEPYTPTLISRVLTTFIGWDRVALAGG